MDYSHEEPRNGGPVATSVVQVSPVSDNGANLEKTFLGHPRGLITLFLTEMWERFSFYGMRALLVLYLISGGPEGGLGVHEDTAKAIYAVYLAMVYLLTMPGGWFADRLWGPRKTVIFGACIVIVGHFALALPGELSFFLGLACVAAGSGLLKSNISTLVGHLYADLKDPRRDSGFTIFYIGINCGAFAAPLVIGTIGQSISWHLGFATAGVGMAVGLALFLAGTRTLSPQSGVVPTPLSKAERRKWLKACLVGVAGIAIFYGLVNVAGVFTNNWILVPLALFALGLPSIVLIRIKKDKDLTYTEQSKVSGYIWLFGTSAIFSMIFEQAGSTLNIFATENTMNAAFGIKFPSTWFQSINSVWVMALAPVFAMAWLALAKRGKEPSTAAKFSFSLLFIGLSFVIFLIAMQLSADGVKVSPLWLVLIYMVQTIGELLLSPVGLSATTKLAPKKYASQMMGMWFLSVSAGSSVASLMSIAGADLNSIGVVSWETIFALLAGGGLWMSRKKIKQLMGDVH